MKSIKVRIWIFLQVSVLTLALQLPYGLNLAHALEFHKEAENSHSKNHLHQLRPDCKILDYCFQPITFFPIKVEYPKITLHVNQLVIHHTISLPRQTIKNSTSRGPPNFII